MTLLWGRGFNCSYNQLHGVRLWVLFSKFWSTTKEIGLHFGGKQRNFVSLPVLEIRNVTYWAHHPFSKFSSAFRIDNQPTLLLFVLKISKTANIWSLKALPPFGPLSTGGNLSSTVAIACCRIPEFLLPPAAGSLMPLLLFSQRTLCSHS